MDLFRFKQFDVIQNDDVFRISTDAILLGAWTNPRRAASILDAGTGCGVIALMLAQRCDAKITGVERLRKASKIAGENFTASQWHERLKAICADVRAWVPKYPFDLLVCNPPFYKNGPIAGTEVKDHGRNSRHLEMDDLFVAAGRLTTGDGAVSIILPASRLKAGIIAAQSAGWYTTRRTDVFSKNERLVRHLLSFSRNSESMTEGQLRIQDDRGSYTEEYINLCRPYLRTLPGIQL